MAVVREIHLTNINRYYGFIDVAKSIANSMHLIPSPPTSGLLFDQRNLQKNSYDLIEKFFSEVYGDVEVGKKMQILTTKIDIVELTSGLIDLSSPDMHLNKYESSDIEPIFIENDKALEYLQDPFNLKLSSNDFEGQLDEIFALIQEDTEASCIKELNDFLNLNEKSIDEVILFTKVLNLICLSQSFFAFAHQIKRSVNFMRLIELILITDYKKEGVQNIIKMADRFSSLYVGNLAIRTFNNKTLTVIEDAFATKEIK